MVTSRDEAARGISTGVSRVQKSCRSIKLDSPSLGNIGDISQISSLWQGQPIHARAWPLWSLCVLVPAGHFIKALATCQPIPVHSLAWQSPHSKESP